MFSSARSKDNKINEGLQKTVRRMEHRIRRLDSTKQQHPKNSYAPSEGCFSPSLSQPRRLSRPSQSSKIVSTLSCIPSAIEVHHSARLYIDIINYSFECDDSTVSSGYVIVLTVKVSALDEHINIGHVWILTLAVGCLFRTLRNEPC